MPLTAEDRKLLSIVGRLKAYVLLMAVAVLVYVLFTPQEDLHLGMTILAMALCGIFWLTQRLLSFISRLDFELTRLVDGLKRALPERQRRELFPSE